MTSENGRSKSVKVLGFQYEPESLDINGVCFDKEQNIPNEESRKIKTLLNSADMENVEYWTQMLSTCVAAR